jgi:hypothetical protein
MNLARLLFKPKWQDKNADVRRAAVASANDAELVAALPQIARADTDAGVRLAALKRLGDYEAWRERSTGDTDAGVRRTARDTYLALLCSNDARVPALTRRIAELDTLSAEELERVATQATDRELRADALSRVTRPALLAERAVADADASIRLAALERVTDAAALERIAERARKTDKTVSRRARELIEAQRIGRGDAAAVAQKARALCERMESLVRAPAHEDAIYEAIAGEWDALGNAVPTELIARYCGADALVRQTKINVLNAPVREAAAPADETPEPETAPAAEPAAIHPEMLASQARFDAALANAAAEAQRERELRRTHLHELEQVLPRYAAALEAGTVSAAHALHDRLLNLTAMVVPLPAAIEAKLAPLHAHYAELKQQQTWANRHRRDMLCDDIERLAQSGLHPDALALRVREAREEWQRLDAAEGISGKESGPARRFQALCHRALKPAKAYFDKRDEVRKSHSGEIEKLLQEATDLPADILDWKAAGQLRLKLGDALRSLDGVDPRTRTELARRLKAAIEQLAARLDAHATEIETAKQRLVVRAQALQQQTDGRSVARDARELQTQWTALGNGRRGSDQRLWKEFRGALDAAFGQLDATRKQREEQTATLHAEAQNLIVEIEVLQADASKQETQARLRDIDTRWHALGSVERAQEQQYRKAHDAIETHLRGAARRKRLARYTQALEKYVLLRGVESGAQGADAASASWHEHPVAAEFAAVLNARFARAAATPATAEQDEDPARDLLVELEFFAGLETPAADRQRRMNFQVQRLASRMRDRAAATPEAELSRLLTAWFTQAAQADGLEDRFAYAAAAAVETLP